MFGSRSVMFLALAGACAFAQPSHRGMGGPPPGGPGDFAFMHGEFGFAGKVVAGSPYSAQASTQFTQTLADGTHIQRSTTATLARDSQGRTRREETVSSIGRLSAGSSGTPRTTVFIHDPVASMSYVLDSSAHTVRQMQISQGPHTRGQAAAGTGRGKPHGRGGPQNATTEDLGTQVIQGVNATGTRITRTVAAGAAGNDRAIQVVTETWYSADLQMVVMSKTSDPRFGESVYQLTNITRAEPDASMFAVPSGYTVMQGGPPRRGTAAQ
jgi:hypothetical protein